MPSRQVADERNSLDLRRVRAHTFTGSSEKTTTEVNSFGLLVRSPGSRLRTPVPRGLPIRATPLSSRAKRRTAAARAQAPVPKIPGKRLESRTRNNENVVQKRRFIYAFVSLFGGTE